ncbi:MAG: UDP-N-acetylglucosamine 1-carboxyvinyltransferase [Firmicutes bacterium]|nr:UDP-N-acetylglucosamine 1-carboxyvinyltransferase [Bacillota bacterium]
MAKLIIRGGNRLEGVMRICGAKNSVLPILAASLLVSEKSVLQNCPALSDVRLASEILRRLGCTVEREEDRITIDPAHADGTVIPEKLMSEMRSSIIFLGAMAARNGRAVLSAPGGCDLGPRPIDLHLAALRKMGAEIVEEGGIVDCRVNGRLHGAEIRFPFVSVGATENVLIAAAAADGATRILNAACEPEICDLAQFLIRCGARITGAGTSRIIVEGVRKLHGCEHRVIPDRIAAATYLLAASVTGGDITLSDVEPQQLSAVLPRLQETGCELSVGSRRIRVRAKGRPKALSPLVTAPYPGFPTDAQAPFMALCCIADGTTAFEETIFRNRFRHAAELNRMGAEIGVTGQSAVVKGVPFLHGARVSATDLRGGAALVLAALSAEGETEISQVHHIDRGYESMECALSSLGASAVRTETWQIKEENRIIRTAFAM